MVGDVSSIVIWKALSLVEARAISAIHGPRGTAVQMRHPDNGEDGEEHSAPAYELNAGWLHGRLGIDGCQSYSNVRAAMKEHAFEGKITALTGSLRAKSFSPGSDYKDERCVGLVSSSRRPPIARAF